MPWLIVAVIATLLVALAVLVVTSVLRFNQLSLVFELCRESRRQLMADIANRHLLFPAFLDACSARLGPAPEVAVAAGAFTSARDATEFSAVGPAEEELSEAVEGLALAMHASESPGAGAEVAFSAAVNMDSERFLYTQIVAIEGRIAAAVRHYNLNVNRYHRRRDMLLSAPLRGMFRPCQRVAYSDSTTDPLVTSKDALAELGEDYRPGRLSEEL